MKTNILLLCTVTVALSGFSAHAEMNAAGSRYMLRPQISQKNHTRDTHADPHLAERRLLPVTHSYTILFDLNKADIRENENQTINQIIRDIDRYHPKQITVTGYTDSSGDMAYNMNLSHKREHAVSMELLQRAPVKILLGEDRGETDQAVKTDNGVMNQENRRVVVDLRR